MKQVTVFSTSQCAVCQTLKQWLDRQQISYQAINLEEQPQHQADILAKSGSLQVPITLIKDTKTNHETVINGPQYSAIKKALELA